MAEELPPRIGEIKIKILQFIEQRGEPVKTEDVIQGFSGHDEQRMRQNVHHLANLEYLVSKKKAGDARTSYSLTVKGKYLLKHLDQVTIMPDKADGEAGKRGRPKGAKAKKKTIDDITPMAAPLNMSVTANSIMDNISVLIDENAKYREAMIKAANTIASYVGMRLVPIQSAAPEQIQEQE